MEIDGVFSGGGIKGFALIGALAEIEKQGFQFKRVAGTSAGSIISALIIAGYSSDEIERMMDDLDLKVFLDSRKSLIPIAVAKWIFLFWSLGLYKGNELEKWIEARLAARGIRTFADVPPLSLRIISSDLTNGRLLVLPDDLPKYQIDPNRFSVAKAVRMSCSMPYFFEPVKIGGRGKRNNLMVDGGVLSNFPMWLFDKDNVKKTRPVLGVKLSINNNEQPPRRIKNAIQMFEALFETMKDAHDSRYISRSHEQNVIFVPTEGVLATEFELTEEGKRDLLKLGRERAKEFLATWTY
ncbi:patatin-like phospholipase family protein [Cytobacillus kochii]|uniref:patatin-like phospholipase family protein n=1 Tax=Cytobacillus kochii TaxID=859143 RepID=UPI00203B32D6|nr:patatin-like phospholipase family protein [Cytobacillus kochii]MCM3320621.1 patatin-like phospholipase family protein [Cytobacillus kochii]MCM3344545.1 patatin-like phospholipase family protein [Cytobacillus kochii]